MTFDVIYTSVTYLNHLVITILNSNLICTENYINNKYTNCKHLQACFDII